MERAIVSPNIAYMSDNPHLITGLVWQIYSHDGPAGVGPDDVVPEGGGAVGGGTDIGGGPRKIPIFDSLGLGDLEDLVSSVCSWCSCCTVSLKFKHNEKS